MTDSKKTGSVVVEAACHADVGLTAGVFDPSGDEVEDVEVSTSGSGRPLFFCEGALLSTTQKWPKGVQSNEVALLARQMSAKTRIT